MANLIYDRHPTAKSAGGYEDLPFMWSYNAHPVHLPERVPEGLGTRKHSRLTVRNRRTPLRSEERSTRIAHEPR